MNVTKNQAAAAGIITAIIITALIIAYVATKQISSHGQIKTLGLEAYADRQLTQPAVAVDWGLIGQGETATAIVYLRLIGNLNATLTLAHQDADPLDAFNYMSLTWNYTGATVQPSQVVCVTLSLAVAAVYVPFTDFSFDIIITATH